MVGLLLGTTAAVMPLVFLGTTAPASAGPLVTAASDRTTGCGIKLTRDVFSPTSVTPGETAYLHLSIENCTDHARTVRVQTDGKLVCLVVDPLLRSFTIAAKTTRRLPATGYTAPDCTGTATIGTTVESTAGKVLASGTASFTVTASSG